MFASPSSRHCHESPTVPTVTQFGVRHNTCRHRSSDRSRPDKHPRSRGAYRPSFAINFLTLSEERGRREDRVRAAPAVPCANRTRVRTRAYRSSGEHPAFPAQWLYGLCRDLPGDEFFLVTVACGLKICPSPVGPTRLHRLDTSNGCQDHTVLPYATTSFVRVLSDRSRIFRPALQPPARPTLPRPPHPIPTFVTWPTPL